MFKNRLMNFLETRFITQLVKEYLTDTRWREVFLLTAELMGDEVGNLLSLMQAESQHYINTPKLQNLLHWADEITSETAGNINPVDKRLIALTIADYDAFPDSYAYEIGYTIAIANITIKSHANKAHANDIIHMIVAYTTSINEAIQATLELEKLQIFNHTNFTELAGNLKELKFKIPNHDKSLEEHTKFTQKLQDTLLVAFKLTPEMIDLSKEELKTLDEKHLYANKLIIDCKKSAIGETSPLWWQEIEDRMLKPNL